MRLNPLRLVVIVAITAALGVKTLFWLNEPRVPATRAQDGVAAEDASAPSGSGVISGTVYDEHGRAAGGRSIRLLRLDPPEHTHPAASVTTTVRSDTDGRYRLERLDPGRYLVVAAFNISATERVFHPDAARIAGATPVSIEHEQERSGVDLRYRPSPAAVVQGTVTRENGAPVRITVDLILSGAPEPERLRLTTGTDESGRFTFTGVPADDYWIVAHTQVRGTVSSDSPILDRPLVAMDSLSPAGQTTTALTLVARPAMNVSVRLAFDGIPAASSPDPRERTRMLHLTGRDRRTRALLAVIDTPARAGDDGVVTIHGVPAGQYTLLPVPAPPWRLESARRGSQPWRPMTFEVTGGTDLNGIEIGFAATPQRQP